MAAVVDVSRLNSALAFLLMAIVAIAPIPFGSNRPAIWMLLATVIGGIGIWYSAALIAKRAAPRVPIPRFWPETLGLIIFLVFAAIQVVPVRQWLNVDVALPSGDVLPSSRMSVATGDSWLALIGIAAYGLFTLLVLQAAANRRRARRMLAAVFVIIVMQAVFALVNLHYLGDTTIGFPKEQYQGFATGTFINRNSFATFVAMGLSVGVALLFDLSRRERELGAISRWITIPMVCVGLAFVAAALLSSGSRMGAFSGALGLAATAVLGVVTAGPKWRSALLIALAVFAALGLAFLVFGSGTISRLVTIDVADDARWDIYNQVIAAIELRPWWGYGGGSFITAFPPFQHAPLSSSIIWNKAHNTYLALWFEYGVVFGSIPMLIILSLAIRALRGAFSASSRPLALAVLGVVVTISIHSIVDFSLEIQANVYLMLAVLALGAAHVRAAGTSETSS